MAQWPLTIGGSAPEQSGLEWLSLSQWGKLDCFSGDYSDFSDTAERPGCLVAWLLLLIECDKVSVRTFWKFLHIICDKSTVDSTVLFATFSLSSLCCQWPYHDIFIRHWEIRLSSFSKRGVFLNGGGLLSPANRPLDEWTLVQKTLKSHWFRGTMELPSSIHNFFL